MGRKRPDREFQARIAARADELRAAEYCNAGPGPQHWFPILWVIGMVLAGWILYNVQRLGSFIRGGKHERTI